MNRRFRVAVEGVCFVVSVVLAIVTRVAPTWLERTVGLSPDGGSGETEWGVVVAFAVVAAVSAAAGVRDLRRLRAATASS